MRPGPARTAGGGAAPANPVPKHHHEDPVQLHAEPDRILTLDRSTELSASAAPALGFAGSGDARTAAALCKPTDVRTDDAGLGLHDLIREHICRESRDFA
jgi:hypothetical protein